MVDVVTVKLRRLPAAAMVTWLLLALTAGYGWSYGYAHRGVGLSDWQDFEFGARVLLGWHRYAVFGGPRLHLYVNNPSIQIGPPALLLVAAFQSFLSPAHALVVTTLLMSAIGLLAYAAIVRACWEKLSSLTAWQRNASILLAGIPALWGASYLSGLWTHVDDLLAVSLAAFAAPLIARNKHWWLVGLLLGSAAAAKPWAIIFIPMLLGLARSDWAKATLAAIIGAAIWWAPFILAAHGTSKALGGYPVAANPGSVLYLLGFHAPVERWLRPVQFIGGVALATLAARRTGWRSAPMAGLAFRVATDPYVWLYYALGPLLMATMWDFGREHSSDAPRWRRVPWLTLITVVVELALPYWSQTGRGLHSDRAEFVATLKLAWAVGVLILTVRPWRRHFSPVDSQDQVRDHEPAGSPAYS